MLEVLERTRSWWWEFWNFHGGRVIVLTILALAVVVFSAFKFLLPFVERLL